MGYHETNLLKQAINAFFMETGLTLVVCEEVPGKEHYNVVLGVEGFEHLQFTVEIKKWAQQANLGVLVNQIQQLPMKGLLVADYVDPKMAARLRELDVPFVDTMGNAFINQKPLYIFIKGLKKKNKLNYDEVIGQSYGRIFQPTGIKILYALLRTPKLVNAPYREISNNTGVALGSVGRVFNDLKKGGYLVENDKKYRRLINKKYLLDRWVDAYLEKLRPKLFLGVFAAEKEDWWRNPDMDISVYGAKWGGEIAAEKLTGELKPEKVILYLSNESGKQLFLDKRLRKNLNGNIQIYNTFQEQELQEQDDKYKLNDIVDPIIIYADLLATGDPRNIETARIIYEQKLAGLVRED